MTGFGKTYTALPPIGDSNQEEDGNMCGDCGREVQDNQNGLCCDLCDKWYHAGCQKVTLERYKMMQKLKEITWFCKGCKGKYKDLKSENRKLREEVKELHRENKELKDRMEAIEEKVENFDGGANIVERVKQEVLASIKEMEDKKARQNNLILFGVPESTKLTGTEREDDDTKMCKNIFEERLMCESSIEKTIRIGNPNNNNDGNNNQRKSDKPRLLLVRLADKQQKYEILKNARKLASDNSEMFRRIYIGPDQTVAEREENRKLREELRRRREEGQTGWYIKQGRLQRGNFQ